MVLDLMGSQSLFKPSPEINISTSNIRDDGI